MKKAERNRVRDLLRARTIHWMNAFGIDGWEVTFNWCSGKPPENEARWVQKGSADADWRYLRFTATYNLRAFADDTDEEIDTTACHEVLHAALDEMREWREEHGSLAHEERVVSTISQALIRAFRKPPPAAAPA